MELGIVWKITKWIYAVGGAVWLALYVQSSSPLALFMTVTMIGIAALIEIGEQLDNSRGTTPRSGKDKQ